MIRLFIIFAIALFITLFVMWSNVRAEPKIPALNQLIAPPSIIEYQREPHAVFNYGGLQFLYVIKKMPTAFKTDHSLHWDELVQKTCIEEGCK